MIDEAFQDMVLACMQRVPEFNAVACHHIQPDYFDGAVRKNLAKMMIDFWMTYDTLVTDRVVVGLLKDLVDTGRLEKIEIMSHGRKFKELREVGITEWKYILDKLIDFIKHQKIKALIELSVKKHLPKGNYGEIEKEMAAISSINVSNRVQAYDYFDETAIQERSDVREKELTEGKSSISTGIPEMDAKLHAKGYYKKELYIYAAPPKRGKCVVRDTMIFTEDGLTTIGDYVPESLENDCFQSKEISILGMHGVEKTSHVYNSGLTLTKKVTTANGMNIEGTFHHPMLVMKNGKHEWVHLENLRQGDWLVSKKGQRIFGKSINLQYAVDAGNLAIKNSKRADTITPVLLPEKMDNKLATFLAMFVAEGYGSYKNDITFTQNCKETLTHYQSLINELFGKELNVLIHRDKSPVVQMGSVVIRTYLESLGVSWRTSSNKVIPEAICKAPEHIVKTFLNVLLSLEGAVIKSKKSTVHFEVTMASERLMKQVQMLLLNFGITSRLCEKSGYATNGSGIVRSYWRIKVSGSENLYLLKKHIGLYDARKHDNLPDYYQESITRDWIPESRELMIGVVDEIKKSGKTISSLFSKTEHYYINRFSTLSGKEKRCLTISFAKRIIEKLASADIRGNSINALKYIIDNNFVYTQVESILDGQAVTVDFTVPNTHSFVANGLISHNTMKLLWASNQGALQGYNVAHFTCEVSREVCSMRLDAMNAKTRIHDVAAHHSTVAAHLRKRRPRGRLMLFEYPTKSLTVNIIDQQIDRLRTEHGIIVDMLVVDYLDILKHVGPSGDSNWSAQGPLAEDLRGLAGKYGIPVVTATQINRQGAGKAVTSGADVAGNFEKIMIADEVFTLSATDEELKSGILRINNSESRNSESGTIVINTKFSYGQFYAETVGVEI